MYKVYIKLDSNNCITGVESTAFHTEEELKKQSYIYLDQGEEGETFGHAQPNYFKNKYGKQIYDEQRNSNFKYVDGKVIELTQEEKKGLFKPLLSPPTVEERLAAAESAILSMMGGM